MIASVLRLSRTDIKKLKITDEYSLHRTVYGLYEDVRTDFEKSSSISSGILYADKGGDWNCRQILMLSNRQPCAPEYGKVESKTISDDFLQHDEYAFEIQINPTKRDKNSRKLVALRDRDAIATWFVNKSLASWGFSVKASSLQIKNIGVKSFEKKGHVVTLGSATLLGQFVVTDRVRFMESFRQGVGRGRAFGFGLLQIVPLSNLLFF